MSWWDNLYKQSFAGAYKDAKERGDTAAQGQAVAGGIITGLTGATTLLSNAFKDAQIRDTSMQENQIADLSRAGAYNYNNYDQLANDYAQTNFGGPNINYQDIRGMTTGQQIGSVGTSMLSGAATGLQIGGPWGALAGLAVGGLTGIGGVLAGDSAARTRQESLNIQAQLAGDAAQQNFAAAHERIGDNIHRQNAVNAVKYGGEIHRMIDDTLLKTPKQKEYRCGGKVQKLYCNGGVKIRIKK